MLFQILGRTLRVDHCEQYKVPNADMSKLDEQTAAVRQAGCAPVAPITEQVVVKQVMIVYINKTRVYFYFD